MKKYILGGVLVLFVLLFSKQEVGESNFTSYPIKENIQNIGAFLKKQDYFMQVSQLCHESDCFAIDVHDLKHSIEVMEQKVLQKIKEEYGEEKSLETSLKGFAVTKVLTH